MQFLLLPLLFPLLLPQRLKFGKLVTPMAALGAQVGEATASCQARKPTAAQARDLLRIPGREKGFNAANLAPGHILPSNRYLKRLSPVVQYLL